MAKNFIPHPIRVSQKAIDLLPAALKSSLIAGDILYAVKPDVDGSTFVSDRPNPVGRICTFIPSEETEEITKTTSKSPKVNVNVKSGETGDNAMLTVTVPENVTDEILMGIISRAIECVIEENDAEKSLWDALVDALNASGLSVTRMAADITITLPAAKHAE